MSTPVDQNLQLEIAHVLFIDIVGYSKLLIDDQRELQQQLNQIVRDTPQFGAADKAGKLVRLPTGDGMALVFPTDAEAPVQCALQITQALQSHPQLRLRMGIHTGPVSGVEDINDRSNVAGAGINVAQRVMSVGDAGHILLSKRAAEDLSQYRKWEPYLHDLGEVEVKHGVKLSVVNLYKEELGNAELPEKLRQLAQQEAARGRRKRRLAASLVLLSFALLAGASFYLRRLTSQSSNSSASIPEKSIAVLPFENRSQDKGNAYFADGIQDEILTRLSKIGDLKVISRTSTEKYRDHPDNLRTVAQELGVGALLEGSVQKAGGKIRVVVQLIEARTDQHLWAETYDRALDDIFAVQSEIASQVANALHANLTPHESVVLQSVPTNNQKAYDLFLRANYFLRNALVNFTSTNVPEAIELFRQAVAEDPGFALAYARLSYAESFLRFAGEKLKDGLPDQPRIDAEKSMTLQPDLVEAHLALAYCDYLGRFDYERALEHLTRAHALAPKNTEVLIAFALVYRRLLRFDEAIAMMERAAQYDPQNPDLFYYLGLIYKSARRDDKVQPAFEHALALNPGNEGAARILADFLLQRGDLEDQRKLLRGRGPSSQLQLAYSYFLTRDYETAIRLVEELPAESPAFSDQSKDEVLGIFLDRAGQGQRARSFLERAREYEIGILADKTNTPRILMLHSLELARIEVARGARDSAIQIAESLAQSDGLTRDPLSAENYRSDLAFIYAHVGRNKESIALLAELLKSKSAFGGVTPYLLRVDPDWDPLRNDPRFQALLKEYPTEPRSH